MAGKAPPPTVFASGINAVLQVAESFGAQPEDLLARIHLQAEWLRNPDDRLPVARLYDLYRLAAEDTGNPDIGLYVGRVNYLTGLNLQLYMSTICQTFREYLNLIPRILKLRGDIGELRIKTDGDFVRLEWKPPIAGTAKERYLSDAVLSSSAMVVNSLCVIPIPVEKACFTYPRPRQLEQLQVHFSCNLEFDQAVSCLYFDRRSLDYPLIQPDGELHEEIASYLRDLFEDDDPSDRFVQHLHNLLAPLLHEGEVSIDRVAAELGMSRRTLQRRLTNRNTYFLQELQQLRSQLAVRYLTDMRLGITEIAFLLGYTDQASFSTAFKHWHDCSPGDYRMRSESRPGSS